jgi:hypothetical protein
MFVREIAHARRIFCAVQHDIQMICAGPQQIGQFPPRILDLVFQKLRARTSHFNTPRVALAPNCSAPACRTPDLQRERASLCYSRTAKNMTPPPDGAIDQPTE